MAMTEKITIKGKWFLPTNLDVEVPGILTIDPEEGCYLDIEASFTGKERPYGSDIEAAEIILGESRNGDSITLYSCYMINTGWGDSYQATWYANYSFVGCHAENWSDFRFTKIVARINPLFMWLNSSGIKLDAFEGHGKPATFKFKTPDSIEFPIDSKVTGKFRFTGTFGYPNSYSENIKLNHSAELIITTVEGLDIHHDELWQYTNRFMNWLTVVTSHTCEVEKISFYHRDLIEMQLQDGTNIKQEVVRYSKKQQVTQKPSTPRQFLFDYPRVKKYMPEVMTNWFTLYEDLEIILQILANNMGRETAFSEFHFKDIVQALEAFHRKRIRNERMPKSAYKTYKKNILNQITDESEREFVKERLNYGNEPSLRERLIDLIDKNNIFTLKSIIGDKDEFIKLVVDNRNYYTHLEKNGKKNILDTTALYHLSEKSLALLFTTIINEIIPDKSFIETMLRTSRRWGFRVNQS